jgi:CheY-like chemotaxis protein
MGESMPPVLLLTAHAMRGDRERLLGLSGADDYVAKPIVDHHEFVGTVQRLIDEAQRKVA